MKTNKIIEGKRVNIVLDSASSKILEDYMDSKKITATKIIEDAIKRMPDGLSMKVIEKITTIMRLNDQTYKQANATFSNLNQIAYHLNLAKVYDKETNLLKDNEMVQELSEVINLTSKYVQDLRVLVLQMQVILMQSFGSKEAVQKLEHRYIKALKKMVRTEGLKRGLIQDIVEDLPEDELKRLIEEMEDF